MLVKQSNFFVELLEIVTTDSNLRENILVEDVSCTSNLQMTREIKILDAAEILVEEILDAAEIPDEEKSPRILTLVEFFSPEYLLCNCFPLGGKLGIITVISTLLQ